MPLKSGLKIGPYEVISPLGAGGMGEVYRARDVRLEREVALKVLPESLAGDADRLRRFEQEARAVAALNHPNILSAYDVGSQNGIQYIVTELLEGSTLREKLAVGALPLRRATDYGIQISQALAAAHERGILHRDLKPDNLFVTKDGRVKVLDFGLAKQTSTQTSPDALTLTGGAQTSEGMILGTVGYMSPEQVRGESLDTRSDIFSFGTVMYEMLSGVRAFHRKSSVESMHAILTEDPPDLMVGEGKQISPALAHLVHRCMDKERDRRFQSAMDVSFALESISAGVVRSEEKQLPASAPRKTPWWMLLPVAILLGVGAMSWRLVVRAHQPARYDRITFRKGAVSAARFTSDGQSVIYNAAWDNPVAKLYLSRADGSDTRAVDIPASDLLSVSKAGELAIISKNGISRLAEAPVEGGAPRELLDNVVAAEWSPNSKELAIARRENGKCKVEYPIGKSVYETLGFVSNMRFSPQGDAIAFMDHPVMGDDRGTVVMLELKGTVRKLTPEWEGEWGVAWSPDGHEIWFTATDRYDWERNLYAVTRSGKQRLVLRTPSALYLEDISSEGLVLLRHESRRYEVAQGEVGHGSRLFSWLEIMVIGSLSSDGQFAVIGDWSGKGGKDYSVYFAKLDGSPPVLLGSGAGSGISPDNKMVASILPSDTSKVLLLPTGIGQTKTISAPNFHYRSANWSSDGQRLVTLASEADRPLRFWVQDIAAGPPRPVTPEGTDGVFTNIHHCDCVVARNEKGVVTLYPLDSGKSQAVAGILETDEVIGGAPDSDDLLVAVSPSAVAIEVVKVSVVTGRRQHFVTISPVDPAGIVNMSPPLFSADGKKYLFGQVRQQSILYVADGLK